jgi:transcriptional regulator with XRE-family HTH domain
MALRGERVLSLRHKKGLSQQQLADKLGLGLQQILRYEKGRSDSTGEIIARLAQELGTTADFLLGLIDDPQPYEIRGNLSDVEHQLIEAFRSGDLKAIIVHLANNIIGIE